MPLEVLKITARQWLYYKENEQVLVKSGVFGQSVYTKISCM